MAQNAIGIAQATAIASLAHSIAQVSTQVQSVGRAVGEVSVEQAHTRQELHALIAEFREYVAVDAMHKELALAETRIVKTRQEIEKRFGAYDELRSRATGILRSVDVSVVRQETIRTATEELMLASPRYWLAPALVALAAWVGDQRELSERALAEALRRDDYKTSLLFALVSRRARKSSAAAQWLDRYFRLQDPYALDREVQVLLDAVALGAFGSEATSILTSGISGWLAEIQSKPAFIDTERRRWRDAFNAMSGTVRSEEFPYLAKYSPDWSTLHGALQAARGHAVALQYLDDILDGEIVLPPTLENRIDAILDRLVTDFDDEELELRRAERQLDLIIQHNGDRKQAQIAFQREAASLDEKSSFVTVITSASLGQGNATNRSTQRLAVALSKPWLSDAHNEHIASVRLGRPTKARLTVDDWSDVITEGADETPLVERALAFLREREREAVAKVMHWSMWLWSVVAACVLIPRWFWLAAVLAVIQVIVYFSRMKKAQGIRDRYARNREAAESIVRASVAEYVDFQAAWDKADPIADRLTAKIDGIVPEHFFASHPRERVA